MVLACTLHVHPRLQACNTILYQVGRIDWKERKRAELQESEREREREREQISVLYLKREKDNFKMKDFGSNLLK